MCYFPKVPLKTLQRRLKKEQSTSCENVDDFQAQFYETDTATFNDEEIHASQNEFQHSSNSPLSVDQSDISSASENDDLQSTSSYESDDQVENDDDDFEIDSDDDDVIDVLKLELSLYAGSTITIDKAVFLIAEYFMKFKIKKNSLEYLLKVISTLLPENHQLPSSFYKFSQHLRAFAPLTKVDKHYYCKSCNHYYSITNLQGTPCEKCLSTIGYGFFFVFDIAEQIKFLFEHRHLAKILKAPEQRDLNEISDIFDGSEYIRATSCFQNKSKYDLTLILNTDGVAYSKSSKACLWPVMFTIVEIPEYLRESFILVNEIWYDTIKPKMNTLLRPLSLHIKQCFDNGITWKCPDSNEEYQTRIIAPLIVADAPARAEVQNILEHNGRFPCNTCEVKTKRCELVEGLKRVRIIPFSEDNFKLRTNNRMKSQAQRLCNTPNVTNVKGVKGSSIVTLIPSLDLSTCVFPEFMHSVLLGVVKQFMKAWFASTNSCNIKQHITNIDKELLNIRPPNTCQRLPRSVTLFKKYKASEFLYWLLNYSVPILIKYLPEKLFQHWILLVMATFILLQKKLVK